MNNTDIKQLYTEIKDSVVRRIKGNRKEVALTLSSGGARGLAHIGAIEELQARGYHIHAVSGTSMGALVGGIFATGKLAEYRKWMAHIDRRRILELTDFSPRLDHLVRGKRIIDALKKIVPDVNIEDLPIPFAAVATDWESGHEIVFTQGSLWQAIRASISVPAYFSPVRLGGKLLIDGGTTNPLPLNRVKRQPGDLLVGINVCGHDYKGEVVRRRLEKQEQIKRSKTLQLIKRFIPQVMEMDFNYYTLLNRTMSIMIHQNSQLQIKLTPPDILVDLPMLRYGGNDYDKSEKLIAIGRQHMRKALDKYEAR